MGLSEEAEEEERKEMSNKTEDRYPPGWDEARVEEVLEHYENQTDEEAIAEDEAAFTRPGETVMPIPNALVDEVEAMIERWQQEG
ncbi:MAG: hypothetical protein DCC49_10645 [Acidobacteria bacterium]|nr:MAG: hypothetical protein DCC49_10645 [Acidobacteriota bacterium]